jgi:hypothetical protein
MIKRGFSVRNSIRHWLLLIAICWMVIPLSASGGTRSSIATNNSIAAHLVRPGIPAVADLDGDKQPDIASGIKVGHTTAGYSYRIDFDLSSNPQQKSFSVLSQEPNGLNIQAIDIDGDHDLDLVITSRLSLQPIGVWINDGGGEFTQGDLGQYAVSALQSRQSIQSPRIPSTTFLFFVGRRPQATLDYQRLDLRTAELSLKEFRDSLAIFTQVAKGSPLLRAPPVSTI